MSQAHDFLKRNRRGSGMTLRLLLAFLTIMTSFADTARATTWSNGDTSLGGTQDRRAFPLRGTQRGTTALSPLPSFPSSPLPLSSAATDALSGPTISGCITRLRGEIIDYAGRFPGATDALLVRSIDSSKDIAWETAAVPENWNDEMVRFVMLAGFDTKPGGRRFRMFVNDEEIFSFLNPRDTASADFTSTAPNGMRLAFRTLLIDVHGDAFGLFTLEIPRATLRPGAQRLAVRGESAGDRRWFMVYTMPLAEGLTVRTDECLLRGTDGAESQRLRAGIWQLGETQPVLLEVTDTTGALLATQRLTLAPGHTEIAIPVPPVDAPRRVVVRVGAPVGADSRPPVRSAENSPPLRSTDSRRPVRSTDNRPPRHEVVHLVQPVRRYTVYLLPHSHVDIGYTDLQQRVQDIHWNNIDAAIDLADRTQNYPEGSRFVWNLETVWALAAYTEPGQLRLPRSAKRTRDPRLEDALKKGWLHLDATYTNTNTSANNAEELFELFHAARWFSFRYNIPVTSMMQVDIPGAAWGVVTAAARSGIRYFVSAPNNSDRIGLVREAWEDKPFYWISQSGRDTLLYWQIQPYSLAYGLKGQRIRNRLWRDSVRAIAGEDPQKGFLDPYLFDHLATLSAKRYPYDMIALSWALSDNAAIDPDLPDAVRAWNERYTSPRIVISSTADACAALEARYGAKLPHHSGDMTEYWTDGIGSGARETAMKRAAVEKQLQAETLALMRRTRLSSGTRSYAWPSIALFSEHTWGAWNSTSEPDHPDVRAQWRVKRHYADTAAIIVDRELQRLLHDFKTRWANEKHPGAFDVFNTSSWKRSGLVQVPAMLAGRASSVLPVAGRLLPAQRLADGSLLMYAGEIPAFAARRYTTHTDRARPETKLEISTRHISNGIIEVHIDSVTGDIVSLVDLRNGREYVETPSQAGMNSYFYLPGDSLAKLARNGPVTVEVRERGPVRAALLIRSSAPGCRWLEREIRLAAGADFVEIENRLDKIAIREKEGVHFGFAFRVPGGTMRIDAPWATIIPEKDQLPGSCKNWFTVQRHVDISNDTMGVTWATLDAPLMEVGGITARLLGAQWMSADWIRTLAPSQTLYSWALNNHWHTNFRADQEGELRFRYAIRPHGGYDAVSAARFGIEQAQPLLAGAASDLEPPKPGLRIDNDRLHVTRWMDIIEPPDTSGYVVDIMGVTRIVEYVRVYNPTDSAQSFQCRTLPRPSSRSSKVDSTGRHVTTNYSWKLSPRIRNTPDGWGPPKPGGRTATGDGQWKETRDLLQGVLAPREHVTIVLE